ncbi:Maleylacetoacetate isomerase [Cordyceps fumosorosea ARSEF 2679]|uniref:Maleylacetoacetate isomerase n=1 Tax=Cordyceps fumosorosea (strain ARSEF 2679) TaxID=1081104 RepID=A0A167TQN0_CORFA|nr:Maleylacetoacetate isomerase [Cordyceps fumosorosea ARSEF 2679]OAA60845.1 Maleylacetoacetate isomerase [Cordyceps fumosorosea ARSEF 2679]
MDPAETFCLHSFYCSSCAQRIIIAAHLKSIPLTFSYVNLSTQEQHDLEYTQSLNPSHSVPTLVITDETKGIRVVIRQSVSILEYFEERFPDRYPLLPPIGAEAEKRALIRDFTNIITSDVQPPTNSRIAKRVKAIRDRLEDQVDFAKACFTDGFKAYEALLQTHGGDGGFTVGDAVTMADVCLVPAIDQATIYKMDMGFAPRVMEIYTNLKTLPAFQAADWRAQGDTPEKFRV